MITGKNRGFKKGDFVFTGAFPGIIVSDVHTFAPCCEVWGFEHETGSAYASDLRRLTFAEFCEMVKAHGHGEPEAYCAVAKKAILDAKGAAVLALSQELAGR